MQMKLNTLDLRTMIVSPAPIGPASTPPISGYVKRDSVGIVPSLRIVNDSACN